MIASIVVPSRNRPVGLTRIIESIRQTTKGIETEIIAVLDEPDVESHDLVESMGDVRTVTMPPTYKIGNSMRKWQAGYKAASCEWVVQSSDDIVYEDEWLEAVLKHPSEGFVALWNPHYAGNIASLFVATKGYIETVMNGHFGLPWYYANWADNEWTHRARIAGALTFCEEAGFIHLHHSFTNEPPDEIARLVHETHALDQATFFARQAAGFPEDWPEVW